MSTAIAERRDFVAQLQERAQDWKASLPAEIPPERFVAVVRLAVMQTPDLLNCDRRSLWKACMLAAKDGLLPDGREAAMVPFKGQVQYLPMYQGLQKRARNSGKIAAISARAVHEHDKFGVRYGDDEAIFHEPALKDRGHVIAAYCIVRLTDGAVIREVLTRDDIDKIRAASRASKGPWFDWEEEMVRAKACKRALKWVPWSLSLPSEIEATEAEVLDVPPPRPTFRPAPAAAIEDHTDDELTPEQEAEIRRIKEQLGESIDD